MLPAHARELRTEPQRGLRVAVEVAREQPRFLLVLAYLGRHLGFVVLVVLEHDAHGIARVDRRTVDEAERAAQPPAFVRLERALVEQAHLLKRARRVGRTEPGQQQAREQRRGALLEQPRARVDGLGIAAAGRALQRGEHARDPKHERGVVGRTERAIVMEDLVDDAARGAS